MAHLQASMNKILEQSGTLLLSVWSETGDLVPNYSVHTSELNKSIKEYQDQLDELDLEIQKWLARKKTASNGVQKHEPASQAATASQVHDRPLDDDLGFGDFLNESNMDYLF